MEFPNLIHKLALEYNEAYVLIELNDSGQEVADVLQTINEYHNILGCSKENGVQILGDAADEKLPGITTTGPTKSKGCTTLRALVENKQLKLFDFRVQEELSNFTLQNNQYKASPGNKDDMAMCGVIFAWATTQDFFKELSDTDIRSKLYAKYEQQIEDEILPVKRPVDIDKKYQLMIDQAREADWMNTPRWYVLVRDINNSRTFLAGESNLDPKECEFKFKNFQWQEEADEFGRHVVGMFKGFKYIKPINSIEAKEYFKVNENEEV